MNDIEIKYKIPFGPDLIIDGTGRCLTPKLEPYFRVPSRRNNPNHVDLQKNPTNSVQPRLTTKSPLCLAKIFKSSDTYTFAIILIVVVIIIAFLSGAFQSTIYEKSSFSPEDIPDYALETAGASIYKQPESTPYAVQFLKYKKTFLLWKMEEEHGGPELILRPWRSAGECWAFSGQEARVQIRLSHTIIPRAVTVEHISKSLSPTGNILSAPREFSVNAVDVGETVNKEHLGTFEYQDNGETIQSFLLFPEGKIRYPARIVEIHFRSNHGNPQYSCVYKIRVHGDIFS